MRSMKNLTLLFLLLFSGYSIAAVDPPELRCISVINDNEISLSWIPPADPANEFVDYVLFVSNTQAGPYTAVNVNGVLNTSTFNYNTPTNTGPVYAYLETQFDDGSGVQNSASSDTLMTIYPVLSNQTDTTATITWNPTHDPLLPTTTGDYRIYRKIGTGSSWQQIATVNQTITTYDDEDFKVCEDSIYYKVEVDDASGCTSISAVAKDLFIDIYGPAAPTIEYLTVLPDGSVFIDWDTSTEQDAAGYIVLVLDPLTGNYIAVDTIFDVDSSQILATPTLANFTSENYTILAFDDCIKTGVNFPNNSPLSQPHETMWIRGVRDFCNFQDAIECTFYFPWAGDADYELFGVSSDGDTTLLQTYFNGDPIEIVNEVDIDEDYCYFVKASYNDYTSFSNVFCLTQQGVVGPSLNRLVYATVLEDGSVEIEATKDLNPEPTTYIFERSVADTAHWIEIGEVLSPANNALMYIEDEWARANQYPVYYRFWVLDECGAKINPSMITKTNYLEARLDSSTYQVSLTWDGYEGWFGVEEYEIYRSVNGADFEYVNTVAPGNNEYIDELGSLIQEGAYFEYYVRAVEEEVGLFFDARANSNVATIYESKKVYIPNAFKPNGVNSVFKPTLQFVDAQNYSLQIYDRFGSLVFASNNPTVGWDGTANGKESPLGVYVYKIMCLDAYGNENLYYGSVTLLR